jgi:hypothetical protein
MPPDAGDGCKRCIAVVDAHMEAIDSSVSACD